MDEYPVYGDAGFTGEIWEQDEFGGFEFITIPNGDPDPYAIVTGDGIGAPDETVNAGQAQETAVEPVYINDIVPLTNENTENIQVTEVPVIKSAVTDEDGTLDNWDDEEEGRVTVYETDTSRIEEQLDNLAELLSQVEVRSQRMEVISNASMGFLGMVIGAFIVFLFIGRLR